MSPPKKNPITSAVASFAVKNGITFPHIIAFAIVVSVSVLATATWGLSHWVGTTTAVSVVSVGVAAIVLRHRAMLYTAFGVGLKPSLPTLTFPDGQPRRLRCVCVSDTHNKHGAPMLAPASLPDGDVLIHAGDFTMSGKPSEMEAVFEWLAAVKDVKAYKHIVCVAGNHDLTLEPEWYDANWESWHKSKADARALKARMRDSCTYLESSGVEINGVRFYGAPYQPGIPGRTMAFNRSLDERTELFGRIPSDTDVLITHGPPHGVLDKLAFGGAHVGCPALRQAVDSVQPAFHVFGHIHESFGVATTASNTKTTFVNAATCNLLRKPSHDVVVFDI